MFQRFGSYFPYERETIGSRFLPHHSPYSNSNKHCLLSLVKTNFNLIEKLSKKLKENKKEYEYVK